MLYQTGTAARQLELEYPDRVATPGCQSAETATPAHQPVCAICQVRQVMVDSRRRPAADLFHTLCFRCYHLQMQRGRMAKRRRAQATVRGASDELRDTLRWQPATSAEPKYRALEHRRRQAQIAARREVEGPPDCSADARRASRVARTAALAGRAG